MGFASIGKHYSKQKTVIFKSSGKPETVTVKATNRTRNGNHIGFLIRINDSKPRHVNVATIDEAIEHGFALWIKSQRIIG